MTQPSHVHGAAACSPVMGRSSMRSKPYQHPVAVVRRDGQRTTSTDFGTSPTTAIVGAGPAGLTAALKLSEAGRDCVVFEASDTVGGISQTVQRDGWRFDV